MDDDIAIEETKFVVSRCNPVNNIGFLYKNNKPGILSKKVKKETLKKCLKFSFKKNSKNKNRKKKT